MRTLQTGNPMELELVYAFTGTPTTVKNYEKLLHQHFTNGDRHIRGEWFLVHSHELEDELVNSGLFTFMKRENR